MKKRIKLVLETTFMMSILTLVPVVSQAHALTNMDTASDQTAESKTVLADRIKERKAELKIKLTTLEQSRLKSKCKNGQVSVNNLSGRIQGLQTSRNNIYDNLTNQLTKLVTKLKDHNVDTTTLDPQITTLKGMITTFKTDMAAYKETVADLGTMDCAADPTGFKASLETARVSRAKLAKDAADIKTYINGTIKPTLVQIRMQLSTTEKHKENE
ncbi:hypothetical protein HY003_00230 [Candidatus Saccharibacteria bacterium]|nr:hypothetical protein [Candidatus Saccharibacteria bacterium]MBI3337718.1 hypothetical protein [Candidatus Saccharibacteria bacterium]